MKDETLKQGKLQTEVIILIAERLTKLRVEDNLSLLELKSEINYAIHNALETKGIKYDTDYQLFHNLKTAFCNLLDELSNR